MKTLFSVGVLLLSFLWSESVFAEEKREFTVHEKGFTAGTVHVVKAKAIESDSYIPREDQILVLDRAPKVNVFARGVIVRKAAKEENFNVKMMRALSVPFVQVSSDQVYKKFTALDGKKVFFKSSDQTLELLEIDQAVYEQFDEVLKKRFLDYELSSSSSIISYRKFPMLNSDKSEYCGPSVNDRRKLAGICIPFYYFATFLKMNKRGSLNLHEYIVKQVEDLGESPKVVKIKDFRESVKTAILEARVSQRHLEEIHQLIKGKFSKLSKGETLRLRASSNAFDNAKISFLSHLESEYLTAKSVRRLKEKALEKLLKKLWISFYLPHALLVRKQFNIDESKALVSVVVEKVNKDFLQEQNMNWHHADPVGFKDPIFMIDEKVEWSSRLEFPEYGPVGHTSAATYKLKIPLGARLKDFSKKVEIEMSDMYGDKQVVKVTKVNRVNVDDWYKEDPSHSVEVRRHRVFFETDHPAFNDLNMAISYLERKQKGRVLSDGIASAENVIVERLVNKNHYPYRSSKLKTNLGRKENKRYVAARLNSKKFEEPAVLEKKVFCYKQKRQILISQNKKNGMVKVNLLKDVEPLILKKDFAVSGAGVFTESLYNPVGDQLSVYLPKDDAVKLGFEDARYVVVTDYKDSKKSELSVFDEKLKRVSKQKLDEDCSFAD